MANNPLTQPPDPDEIELSLFGPGYGESLVIQLGQNEWMIVDSCLTPAREPAALPYLRCLGVNPATAVKLVVASHWHDDHVRGLGKVFQECKTAQFVCAAALHRDEFLEVVRARKRGMMMDSSGVDELNVILDDLVQRTPQAGSPSHVWAMADRPIWHRAGAIPCRVTALSPSDWSLNLAFQQIAGLLPKLRSAKLRLLSPSPNHAAVALWVECADVQLLLGSDLEETTDGRTGWAAIVNSGTKPTSKALAIKVPHHGSKSGHNSRVWAELLVERPVAVLTPFHRGNRTLPSAPDIERICLATNEAYVTGVVRSRASKSRTGAVDKTIRETVRSINQIPLCQGQIRIRKRLGHPDPFRVELFGAASRLQALAS